MSGVGGSGSGTAMPSSPRHASILSQTQALHARAAALANTLTAGDPGTARHADSASPLLVRSLQSAQQPHMPASPIPSPAAVSAASASSRHATRYAGEPNLMAAAPQAARTTASPRAAQRRSAPWRWLNTGADSDSTGSTAACWGSVPCSRAGSFTAGSATGAPAACALLGPGSAPGLRFGPAAPAGPGGPQAWGAAERQEWRESDGNTIGGLEELSYAEDASEEAHAWDLQASGGAASEGWLGGGYAAGLAAAALGSPAGSQPHSPAAGGGGRHLTAFPTTGHGALAHSSPYAAAHVPASPSFGAGGGRMAFGTAQRPSGSSGGSGSGGGLLSPRSMGRSLSVTSARDGRTGPGGGGGSVLLTAARPSSGRSSGTFTGDGERGGGGRSRPASAMSFRSRTGSAGDAAAAVAAAAAAALAGAPHEVVPDGAAARRSSLLESLASGSGGRGCGRVGRALVGLLPPAHPAALALPLEERLQEALADGGSRTPPSPAPSPPAATPPSAIPQFIRRLSERRESEVAAAAADCAFGSPDPSAWMNQMMAERAAALAAATAPPGPACAWSSAGGGTAQDPAAAAASVPGSPPLSPATMQPPAAPVRANGHAGAGPDALEGEPASSSAAPPPPHEEQAAAAAAAAAAQPPATPPVPPAVVVTRHTSAEALHQHSLSYLASRDACRALAAASAAPPGAISLRETALRFGGAGARPSSAGRAFTRSSRK